MENGPLRAPEGGELGRADDEEVHTNRRRRRQPSGEEGGGSRWSEGDDQEVDGLKEMTIKNPRKEFPLTFVNTQSAGRSTGSDPKPSSVSSSASEHRSERIPDRLQALVIDNIHSPATFIILNFITKALKSNPPRPVLLFNSNHPYDLWLTLLQKQGILPNSPTYKNLLKISDAWESIHALGSDPSPKVRNRCLEIVRDEVKGLLHSSDQQTPLLIVDDLTTWIWSNDRGTHELIDCFHSFYPSKHPTPFSLVLVFHDDLLNSNRRDRDVFDHLLSRSNVVLRTRSLGGHGHGELLIYRGASHLTDINLPVTLSTNQTTQYRIIDNAVTFYPKGLDRGFI